MPGCRTHVTVGACAFFITVYFCIKETLVSFDFPTLAFGFLACLLGSIFPDIDTASKMQRIFYLFATLFIVYSFFSRNYKLFALFAIISVLILFVRHRTVTHNIIFILILSSLLPIYSFFYFYKFLEKSIIFASFFCLASCLHIFLDFFVSKILKK